MKASCRLNRDDCLSTDRCTWTPIGCRVREGEEYAYANVGANRAAQKLYTQFHEVERRASQVGKSDEFSGMLQTCYSQIDDAIPMVEDTFEEEWEGNWDDDDIDENVLMEIIEDVDVRNFYKNYYDLGKRYDDDDENEYVDNIGVIDNLGRRNEDSDDDDEGSEYDSIDLIPESDGMSIEEALREAKRSAEDPFHYVSHPPRNEFLVNEMRDYLRQMRRALLLGRVAHSSEEHAEARGFLMGVTSPRSWNIVEEISTRLGNNVKRMYDEAVRRLDKHVEYNERKLKISVK